MNQKFKIHSILLIILGFIMLIIGEYGKTMGYLSIIVGIIASIIAIVILLKHLIKILKTS